MPPPHTLSPDILHQPFYCEENVFHLCSHPILAGRERWAVFVSGALGGFYMWHQRAAKSQTSALFWDYHVIVLASAPWEIWDLDSHLGMPAPALTYLQKSFRAIPWPELAPSFRLVSPAELTEQLASDRSHMRDAQGRFQRPPPPWPPVSAPERGSNLHRFIDMKTPFLGEVLSLEALLERVRGAP